ncbi:MAG: polysaccharide deacetylase family protein [bacterium]
MKIMYTFLNDRLFPRFVMWLWISLGAAWFGSGAAANTVAPSTTPPGGLSPSNMPQIVLLTFDDSVTSNSFQLVQSVLTNHVNPNGNPIKSTFFVSLDAKVDYGWVNQLYAAGHEIAIHTMTHSTSTNTDFSTWRKEIAGCRRALSRFAAIPLSDIVGFRAPYLQFNNNSFQILAERGLLYDSSLLEWPGSYSANAAHYLWPYTLEAGVVQSNQTGAFPIQPVPGLFEIPLWNQVTSGVSAVSMDPPDSMDSNAVVSLWKTNFLFHYEGNRAPYGLYLHATSSNQWLSNTNYPWRNDALNAFISWARSHPDVWFITMHDLANFMRDPVAASEALTSTVFQTTTHTPYPSNLISRCLYPNNTMYVCGDCPPVYPAPTNMYFSGAPIPGGVLSVSMNSNAFNAWEYHLTFSNDTSEAAVDWLAVFEFPTNSVFVKAYDGTSTLETNDGTVRLTVKPEMYLLPLSSGAKETNVSFAMKGTAATNVQTLSSALFGLRPIRPTLLGLTASTNGSLMISWDDSAYGYSAEISTNLTINEWLSATNLYGTTEYVWLPSPASTSAFFRIRGLP